jgi:hypothetical protein
VRIGELGALRAPLDARRAASGWGVRTACRGAPYRTGGRRSTEEAPARTTDPPRPGPDCRRRTGSGDAPRYDRFRAGGSSTRRPDPAADRDSALDPARGVAAAAPPRVGRRGGGASRGVHLPRGAPDRPPPQSARPRPRARVDPAGARSRDRLPGLRCSCGTGDTRSRDGRGAADAPRQQPNRQLLYGRERTSPGDRSVARSRAAAGVARPAPPAAHQGRAPGTEVPELDRDEGRREVHDEGAQLGRGRGSRRRHPALQRRPRRRRLDLHAPRHAAIGRRRGPTLSTGARDDAARRADGAGARKLCEGTARAGSSAPSG